MSIRQLREVSDILDAADQRRARRREATSEEDLQNALQALFTHQCIYSDQPLSGRAFTIVSRHREFFERYATAMGFALIIEYRDGMAALRPTGKGYAWRLNRLKKDETLVFLALRYLFEDGTRRGEMSEAGRIATDTDQIYDTVKLLARTEPPGETRLTEILAFARRRGVVRLEERDPEEQVRPVVVLPGVRVIVPDTFVEALVAWLEHGAVDAEADFFDHLADHFTGSDEAAQDGDVTDADDLAADDTVENEGL